MSSLPFYAFDEPGLEQLLKELAAAQLRLTCTFPARLQKDGATIYRGWDITDDYGMKVIMWTIHKSERSTNDKSLEITVGTPSGSKGVTLLKKVQDTIIELGGKQLG